MMTGAVKTGMAAALAVGMVSALGAAALAVDANVAVVAQEGVPGGAALATLTATAKVTAVDAAKRALTVTREDGVSNTYIAGPEVVNFDQIKVGDQVKVTVAESLVVFLRKKGEPAVGGDSVTLAKAPKGDKPAVAVTSTVELTGKIKTLDMAGRKVTLEMSDGKTRTLPVREDVDMKQAAIGDEVVIRSTEALAIRVEKP